MIYMNVKVALIIAFLVAGVISQSIALPKNACLRFYGEAAGLTPRHAKILFDSQRHQEAAWMLANIGETARHRQLVEEIQTRLTNSNVIEFQRLDIPAHEGETSEIYQVLLENGLKAIFKTHPRHWTTKSIVNAVLANPYSEKMASDFAEVMELNAVPLTVIRTINGMEGSLHAFVDFGVQYGYTLTEMQERKLGSRLYDGIDKPAVKQDRVIRLFQFLVYNMDGKNGTRGNTKNVKNWLAQPKLYPSARPGEASGLVALDFGAAFQNQYSAKGNHRPFNEANNDRFDLKGTMSFYLNLKNKLTANKIRKLMKGFFPNVVIQQTIDRRTYMLESFEKRINELSD